MLRTIVLLLMSLAAPAAGDISLGLPVACAVGEDQPCYLQVLMDHDASDGVQDHRCGTLSYDGHGGTDFALRSLAQMEQGVDVIASASGVVKAVRDGMPDTPVTEQNRAHLNGRDCGNGIVIAHPDGWETQYCHMARGSVQVEVGALVQTGTVLGRVGLSGRTTFPHLHLSVRRNGETIDPFAPDTSLQCGGQSKTLWDNPPSYQPGGLISAGFATDVPSYDAVKSGDADQTTGALGDPALVLWTYAFAGRPGDILRMEMTGPDGSEVQSAEIEVTKTQAQFFRASGRKTNGATWWTSGRYVGSVQMVRNQQVISDTVVEITISE